MSRSRSIWLVARREILEQGRSRGYVLSLLFTLLLLGQLRAAGPAHRQPGHDQGGHRGGRTRGARGGARPSQNPYDVTVAATRYADRPPAKPRCWPRRSTSRSTSRPTCRAGELVVRDRVDERIRVVVSTAVTSLRQQWLLAEAGVSGADFVAASQLPAVAARPAVGRGRQPAAVRERRDHSHVHRDLLVRHVGADGRGRRSRAGWSRWSCRPSGRATC